MYQLQSPTHSPRTRGRWISLACGVLILWILVPGESAFAAGGPPSITNFTPTSGKIGTKVTITGTNFTGDRPVAAVWFGRLHAKFAVQSKTSLIATVPKGAKSGKISLHIAAVEQTDTTDAAPAITVTSKASFTQLAG